MTHMYNAMIVNRISSKVFFVTVTKGGEEVDLDVEQAKLPAYSLAHLETLYNTTEQAVEENEKRLVALSETDIPSLKAALKELQSQIEFSKVVLSSEQTAGDKLMLIEGWAPAFSQVEIEAYLNDAHVYYEITDPMPGDNVPIRLNNKGFFAWFEPICKLYMLPKYNELDLTPFFAPFFMVFFGLCLGDSGYGLFLFLGATAYRLMAKKVTPSMKSIISLIQVLAVSTFFCGLLTGTFFGANIYNLDWPIVQRLKHAVMMDNNDMFQLSLILGAIQILFGMVLKAVNQTIQFGFKYAGCDYRTWNAQGVNMWNYKDPWWVQCHGTFQNGVVFDITQGFVYGQLSKDQTHNSYVDIIGTKGVVRMTHDFNTAVVDLHGVNQTIRVEKPFGGKNIDVLCDLFADSVETGKRSSRLPLMRDSAIASEYAWTFLKDTRKHDLPAIGNLRTLEQIRERRKNMKNGYGLLHGNLPKIINP